MTTSIGSSRNMRLIPSGRDEWSVRLAIPSSMSNDATVKIARNSNDNVHASINKNLTGKFDRAHHSLQLDGKRVTNFTCEQYTIHEDETESDFRLFAPRQSLRKRFTQSS